jgi:hypothetical protein
MGTHKHHGGLEKEKYLVVVKNPHFEPHAERSENETPLWFLT